MYIFAALKQPALDTLQNILSKAEELFLNYGVKSITMDDLSHHLGSSKKTLYIHVSNKADLVYKTMVNHLDQEKKSITQICKASKNAVEELFLIGRHVNNHLRSLNPSAVYDLQKYYPKAWQVFLDYKDTFIYNMVLDNLKKGIKQGLYRNDFDPDIIARIYSARTEFIVDQKLFPPSKYSILEVYAEFLTYHIRGIASAKGLKYLEKQKLH